MLLTVNRKIFLYLLRQQVASKFFYFDHQEGTFEIKTQDSYDTFTDGRYYQNLNKKRKQNKYSSVSHISKMLTFFATLKHLHLMET